MAIDWRMGLVDSGRNAMDMMTAFETGRKSTMEQNAIRTREAARQKASTQLATGDAAGAQQTAIAGGDFDYAKAISGFNEDQRKQLDQEAETLGRFAVGIKTAPVEQRRQAFAQGVQALRGRFSPEEIRERYQELEANGWSDAALDGYVSQAISVKDALAQHNAANEQYTLAPGSARYDARGNLIVAQPFAPELRSVSPGETLIEVNPTQPGGGGPASTGGGSRGERNGNPGNIKDGPWARSQPGYIGSDGTFAKFEPGAGQAAQERLLAANYIAKGFDTPAEIVNRYAPPGENSPDSVRNYTSYVAQRLGIGANDPVPAGKVGELAKAMREFETGNTVGRGGGARVVATGAPKAGWQTLSAGEASSMGLPSGPVYQRGPDGEVKAVTGTASASDTSGLTKTQAGVIRTKLKSINSIESQLGRVEAAMADLDKKGWTGALGGLVPGSFDAESDRFDKAVAQLAPLIRQLTRVPGEGAMSDYESRLAELTLPSRRSTKEGRAEVIASMKELLRNTRMGYRELLGEAAQSAPARAPARPAASGGRKPTVSNW